MENNDSSPSSESIKDKLEKIIKESEGMPHFDIFSSIVRTTYNLAEKTSVNPEDSEETIKEKRDHAERIKLQQTLMQLGCLLEITKNAMENRL